MLARMGLRADVRRSMLGLDMRCGTVRAGDLSTVRHRDGSMGRRLLRMTVWLRVGIGGEVLRSLLVTSGVILAIAIVAAGRRGHVWDDLHTTRHGTSRGTTPSSICRSSRSTKPLVELLKKGAADIISSNMNSVRNAHHDKRSLSRQGQGRVRSIKTSA